jgi:hypothetical protein
MRQNPELNADLPDHSGLTGSEGATPADAERTPIREIIFNGATPAFSDQENQRYLSEVFSLPGPVIQSPP